MKIDQSYQVNCILYLPSSFCTELNVLLVDNEKNNDNIFLSHGGTGN